jgi:hypothetical protein
VLVRAAATALLRPGNASSNNAWDHIEVLCLALGAHDRPAAAAGVA